MRKVFSAVWGAITALIVTMSYELGFVGALKWNFWESFVAAGAIGVVLLVSYEAVVASKRFIRTFSPLNRVEGAWCITLTKDARPTSICKIYLSEKEYLYKGWGINADGTLGSEWSSRDVAYDATKDEMSFTADAMLMPSGQRLRNYGYIKFFQDAKERYEYGDGYFVDMGERVEQTHMTLRRLTAAEFDESMWLLLSSEATCRRSAEPGLPRSETKEEVTSVMDSKKHLEEAVWEYIAARRPLRLLAISVLAIGSLSGAIGELEKPYKAVSTAVKYGLGLQPHADEVVLERNAMLAGMFFREILFLPSDSDELRLDLAYLGEALTAIGFGDDEIKSLLTAPPGKAGLESIRIRQKVEGYLEGRSRRYRAFLELGFHLRSLIDAASPPRIHGVREVAALVLKAHASAQDGFQYRLPSAAAITLAENAPVPDDYVVSAVDLWQKLRKFLSIGT